MHNIIDHTSAGEGQVDIKVTVGCFEALAQTITEIIDAIRVCHAETKQNLCVSCRAAQRPAGGASQTRLNNQSQGCDPDLTEWEPPRPSVGLHSLLAPHTTNTQNHQNPHSTTLGQNKVR